MSLRPQVFTTYTSTSSLPSFLRVSPRPPRSHLSPSFSVVFCEDPCSPDTRFLFLLIGLCGRTRLVPFDWSGTCKSRCGSTRSVFDRVRGLLFLSDTWLDLVLVFVEDLHRSPQRLLQSEVQGEHPTSFLAFEIRVGVSGVPRSYFPGRRGFY